MSKLSDTLKSLIGKVAPYAPTIATALGGPGAGAAVALLSDTFLGHRDGDAGKVLAAVSGATPEQLLALKQADYNFELEMERTHQRDRDSAREREVKTGDHTTRRLAYLIVGSFVGMVAALLFGEAKAESALIGTLIGYLSAKAEQVVAYYFGSSAGSKVKTDAMSRILK